jgi:mono/diheme cytochrome c family protein
MSWKGTLAMIRSVRTATVVLLLCFYSGFAFAESGSEIFAMKCVGCHGKDGAGKTAFALKATLPDLRSATIQSKTDRDLHDSIGRGQNHKQYPHAYLMRGMTEGELNSLIGYIRSLKN